MAQLRSCSRALSSAMRASESFTSLSRRVTSASPSRRFRSRSAISRCSVAVSSWATRSLASASCTTCARDSMISAFAAISSFSTRSSTVRRTMSSSCCLTRRRCFSSAMVASRSAFSASSRSSSFVRSSSFHFFTSFAWSTSRDFFSTISCSCCCTNSARILSTCSRRITSLSNMDLSTRKAFSRSATATSRARRDSDVLTEYSSSSSRLMHSAVWRFSYCPQRVSRSALEASMLACCASSPRPRSSMAAQVSSLFLRSSSRRCSWACRAVMAAWRRSAPPAATVMRRDMPVLVVAAETTEVKLLAAVRLVILLLRGNFNKVQK
eukprot:PhM_4_TR10481/c0_g1_i1/m.18785